ncbi:MAG: hypothetical protein ACRENP_00135 [Longimicrobiales bacterium]
MDDFLGYILLFVIFVLGPILDQARRKKQQPPPRQRPGLPGADDARSAQIPRPRQATGRSEVEEESATTMLPDELWEVLTGQPRPRPAPQPVPAPDVELEEVNLEEARYREDVEVETRRSREEAVSLEEIPRFEAPVVVSMESLPLPPRARHAAFHEKLRTVAEPVATAPFRNLARPQLRGRQHLRNAVLYQAVLGPPKALE